MYLRKLILLSSFFLQIFLTSCSDRIDTPSEGKNYTKIYHSKSSNGIEASITFCERISKQTGAPVKPGSIFTTKANSKVYSLIELTNR